MVDFGKFRWQLPTFYSCVEQIARERVHARRRSSSLENYLLFFLLKKKEKRKKKRQTILHKVKKVSPSKKKNSKEGFLVEPKMFSV